MIGNSLRAAYADDVEREAVLVTFLNHRIWHQLLRDKRAGLGVSKTVVGMQHCRLNWRAILLFGVSPLTCVI